MVGIRLGQRTVVRPLGAYEALENPETDGPAPLRPPGKASPGDLGGPVHVDGAHRFCLSRRRAPWPDDVQRHCECRALRTRVSERRDDGSWLSGHSPDHDRRGDGHQQRHRRNAVEPCRGWRQLPWPACCLTKECYPLACCRSAFSCHMWTAGIGWLSCSAIHCREPPRRGRRRPPGWAV